MKSRIKKWLGIEGFDPATRKLITALRVTAERQEKQIADLTDTLIEHLVEHRADAFAKSINPLSGQPHSQDPTPEELEAEAERMDDELIAKGKSPRYGKRTQIEAGETEGAL